MKPSKKTTQLVLHIRGVNSGEKRPWRIGTIVYEQIHLLQQDIKTLLPTREEGEGQG